MKVLAFSATSSMACRDDAEQNGEGNCEPDGDGRHGARHHHRRTLPFGLVKNINTITRP